jgi:purine-binding chemotaxis protein CheW
MNARREILPAETGYTLVCRAGTLLCALPAGSVAETMRPLPVEPLPGLPGFVSGSSIVRGAPVPVVVLSRLLGAETPEAKRFVVVRAGSRFVALAVDDVLGFRSLSGAAVAALPPLLGGAGAAVTELGALDGALMAVLETARLISEEVFAAIDDSVAA